VRDLRPLFDPRSVAVLGASSDPANWGQWLAAGALRGAHRRDVWLVNRKGGEILGQQAYLSLEELPGSPELVVVVLPVGAFEEAIDAALAVGARAIVAITAGLGEVDEVGKEIEHRVVERVRAAGAVLLGPNCPLSLEQALEFIREDGCVEVTPTSIRRRKVELAAGKRQQANSQKARGMSSGYHRVTPRSERLRPAPTRLQRGDKGTQAPRASRDCSRAR